MEKKKKKRHEISRALGENYAEFQNYNVEKLDFFFLLSLCSSVCSVIHVFSFKGFSLMAAFNFFSGKTDEN